MERRIEFLIMEAMRVLVFCGYGINCEEETKAAFELAGAEAKIVHLKDAFMEKISIFDFDAIVFPGGFSFGDDLGAGRVLANTLRHKRCGLGESLFKRLLIFLRSGGYILGICNGFQVLTSLGLLPGLNDSFEQEASLESNDSGKFEDRWCNCVFPKNTSTKILRGLGKISLPVRHAEGKLVVKNRRIEQEIADRNLICMKYCDEKGNPTEVYPYNPNGSFMSCAGLSDPTGRVIGIMPHPEAFLSIYNHPNWGSVLRSDPGISREGAGLSFFKNFVYFANKREKYDQASSYQRV